jgi:FAD/FMN-containing dehydrogenase
MSQLAIDDATIERLRSAIGGEVITPEDSSYEEARRVWNGRIDRHPALVVQCASTEDVAAAVNFGRDNDLIISVRGGGHSTPGYSTCVGGIVINLR